MSDEFGISGRIGGNISHSFITAISLSTNRIATQASHEQNCYVGLPMHRIPPSPPREQKCCLIRLPHERDCRLGLLTSRTATPSHPMHSSATSSYPRTEVLRPPQKQNCYFGLPPPTELLPRPPHAQDCHLVLSTNRNATLIDLPSKRIAT